MNTLHFFFLVQACASLRFNELVESEDFNVEEGRRRRRRRRRRRGPGSPSYRTLSMSTQIDFQAIDAVPLVHQKATRTATSVDRGWMIIFANGGDGSESKVQAKDMYTWQGADNFRFEPKKSHSFGTEVALWDTDGAAKGIWFVGFGNAYADGAGALPTNMIGFGNGINAGTDVLFYSSKTNAATGTTLTHTVKKAKGGAALTIAPQPNLAAVSAAAYPLPTKSVKLGYSYLPAGQYGVAVKADMTGVWRIYNGDAVTDDVDAATAKNPELQMKLTVGHTTIVQKKLMKMYVKYLTLRT